MPDTRSTEPFLSGLAPLRTALAVARLAAFLGLIIVLLPAHLVLWLGFGSMYMPHFFHRCCVRIFGIRVDVTGREYLSLRPAIYMCNHISYLDIIVLGSLAEFVFVAKSDVADWPLFGFLARMQNTVFIRRKASGIDGACREISDRLARGYPVIIFPEGTSTDGRAVVPFKSALFSMFEAGEGAVSCPVVPLCIRLHSIEGRAAEPGESETGPRATYGWYGDMTLVPHLWRFAKAWRTRVEVMAAPPVTVADFPSRKEMARALHDVISGLLARPASPN